MDVVVDRCAGLDISKDEVVGCVRTPSATGRSRRSELRAFPTFTAGLEELADWLRANGVVEVVMEARASTGSRSGICWRIAGSSSSW